MATDNAISLAGMFFTAALARSMIRKGLLSRDEIYEQLDAIMLVFEEVEFSPEKIDAERQRVHAILGMLKQFVF